MGKSLYILCFRKLAIRPLFVSQQMAVAALANLCECLNFFKLFYLFYLIIIFFSFNVLHVLSFWLLYEKKFVPIYG